MKFGPSCVVVEGTHESQECCGYKGAAAPREAKPKPWPSLSEGPKEWRCFVEVALCRALMIADSVIFIDRLPWQSFDDY